MKRSIMLFAIIVLSSGLLAGCADFPVEDEIEVGYRTGQPATGDQIEVA